MTDPAENMASFDSPVYEHDDDLGSRPTIEATTENQPHQMDDLNGTRTSTHSDASTLPKDSPGLDGVDSNQKTDDFDDDDEHEYTYPDGLTGGTFDAPAPSSALINAPKTEEVMLTEVVIPDSRRTKSLPDYYGASKTKPYRFYGKFHSTYRICKILGFICLALIVVATCTILVLRVSVDHEIFDGEEEPTVATVKEMTYRFTSSIAVTEIDGDPVEFSYAFNDKESDEYVQVADKVENSMDAIYRTGDLSDAYERSIVTNIRYGSVIVDVDLIFKSTKIITSNEVETEIQNELARNNNVIREIMINPQSVSVTDYVAQLSTASPSVKPVTANSTVMPVIDTTKSTPLLDYTTSQLSETESTYEETTEVQFPTSTRVSLESTSIQEESVTQYTDIMATSLPYSESYTESSISDMLITSIEAMETSSSDVMTDSPESTDPSFIETTIAPAESVTPYIQNTLKPTSKPITTSLTERPETSPEEPKTTEEDVRPLTTESPDDIETSSSQTKTSPIVTTSLGQSTQSTTDTISGFTSEYSSEEYSMIPDCAEDEILCTNTTCISIEMLCNGSYDCIPNSQQFGCSISVNSTCAEQLELLVKVSVYYNATILWHYSCLDDGSWNPVQCVPFSNECFCVDEYGFDIPGSTTTYNDRPNCTEAVSTTPSPVSGSRRKRQISVGQQCPEVKCKNGACVLFRQLGDGNDDCGDNSDEKFEDCGENPFICTEYHCIHSDFVCDGEIDCTGNTRDEDNCD